MTLTETLTDYVNAAFTGVWIRTSEPDEAEREIVRHAQQQQWKLAVWDVANGLRLPATPRSQQPNTGAGDPLAALRELPSLPAQRLRRMAAAVRVHFTWWGTHRSLTHQQREEVGVACAADARLLTAGKRLIDTRHPAFRALTSLRSRISSYWRGISLPFTEPGMRLIRQADIEPFVHVLQGFREELQQAEADLNAVYGEVKGDARQRLGHLYNPNDYPNEVRGLFDVAWDFPSVEPPGYLMRISPEVYEQERQRVAARFEEAVRLAEEAFAAQLAELIDHLADRLTPAADGTRKVFRDSAVRNFADFFEKFRTLNVSSNPQLGALVEQAQDLLHGVTPHQVRSLPEVQQRLQAGITEVRHQLDQLVIDAPRRRIIRSRPSIKGETLAITD